MSRTTRILSLSLFSVCALGARSAFAQLLPGNVWPNPTLETPAPAGVDLVYPPVPAGQGDPNPRPLGWHRGGGDFWNPLPPTFDIWDTSKSLSATHSLLVQDSTTSNSGEWFSDYNSLPASSQLTGTPFNFRFNWQYTGVVDPHDAGDVFRVSVRWADSAGDDVTTFPNDLGGGPDALIHVGAADQTTWQQVNQLLTPPINAAAMRVTIDSGGGGGATGNIWVDDISIAAVPEPTSIAVIGGGLMLLAARRRRA